MRPKAAGRQISLPHHLQWEPQSAWRLGFVAIAMLLVLGHNLLFQILILPQLSIAFLRAHFAMIQLLRNGLELSFILGIFALLPRAITRSPTPSWKLADAFQAGVLLILALAGISLLTHASALSFLFSRHASGSELILESPSWQWIVLNSVCLTPLREELFFRGIIWNLLRTRTSAGVATFISASLFSLSHLPSFPMVDLINQFAFGLMLGMLLPRFGLWTCVAVHACVNLLALGLQPQAIQLWLEVHPHYSIGLRLLAFTLIFRWLFTLGSRSWQWLAQKRRL